MITYLNHYIFFFIIFLPHHHFSQKTTGMGAGSFLLLPGGWAGEEEDVPLVYVLERKNASTYAFYITNSNQFASQYHPVFVDSNECGIFFSPQYLIFFSKMKITFPIHLFHTKRKTRKENNKKN